MTVKILFFGSNINKKEKKEREWEGSGQTRAQLT
jgi:hypothetical protein